MKLTIKIIDKRLFGKTFVIDSFPFSIGRLPNNNLQIPYDEYISKVHCTIYKEGENLYLIDLKSTNGTYVNDQLIESAYIIKNEDVIKLGNTNFICLIDKDI